jgi:arginine/lysine/histidine transporter system substrate-binding protein
VSAGVLRAERTGLGGSWQILEKTGCRARKLSWTYLRRRKGSHLLVTIRRPIDPRRPMIHLRSLLLFCSLIAGCASAPKEAPLPLPPSTQWRVGSDLANPPFAWVEEDGSVHGRDVEMAGALARAMGVDLVWERMEFDDLLDKLEAGEIDSVIATLGATAGRAERVLLSTPYYSTSLLVVVRIGAGEPKSLADLKGRPVSAGVGTTSEMALRSHLPKAIAAAPSEKGASSIERLMTREVDALIMDGPDALDYVRERPHTLRVLETPLASENYVVAIRPNEANWLVHVNAALKAMRESGVLARLDRKFELEPGTRSD